MYIKFPAAVSIIISKLRARDVEPGWEKYSEQPPHVVLRQLVEQRDEAIKTHDLELAVELDYRVNIILSQVS